MTTQQKAVFVTEIGKPVKLSMKPIASPGEGQVLVKVSATMLLPHDTYGRDWGLFIGEKDEKILGSNVAGVVESVGSDVSAFQKGDRIFGLSNYHGPHSHQAGLQQYAILDVDAIAKSPTLFTDEQVATLPVNVATSWTSLFAESGFGFPPPFAPEAKAYKYSDQTLTIIGAGSNVGKFAVQFAVIARIGRIIAIAGPGNKQALKSMGATHFVDRHGTPEDIRSQVQSIVGLDGSTHVYDCANMVAEPAISVLSSSRPSKLRTLLPIEGEEGEKIRLQRPQCDFRMINLVNSALEPYQEEFWVSVAKWVEETKLLPTDFRAIDGLEKVKEINEALDAYSDMGRSGVKQVIVNI